MRFRALVLISTLLAWWGLPAGVASIASPMAATGGVASGSATQTVEAADSTVSSAAQATATATRMVAQRCVPTTTGNSTLSFTSSGESRTALVHVPPSATVSVAAPVPLILDFHGYGDTAENAQRRHGFDALTEPLGIITVYPQALEQFQGRFGWNTGVPGFDSARIDDVRYTNDLLDLLEAAYCIDPDRIWATGHSNGGGMTGLLACRGVDRIDAFAPVAGAFFVDAGCPSRWAAPFLEIHGLADETVPYEGTDLLAPIPDLMAERAAINGCSPAPVVDGTRSTWIGCQAPVEHAALPGQTHAYPPRAAEWIVEFFTR